MKRYRLGLPAPPELLQRTFGLQMIKKYSTCSRFEMKTGELDL